MTLSPEQQAEMRELHKAVQAVSAGCKLPTVTNEIERGTKIAEYLHGRLASDDLRRYPYHAELRAMVNAVTSRWEAMVSAALVTRDQESAPLCARAAAIYKMFTHWQTLSGNASEFARMRDQIESEAAAALRAITGAEDRTKAIIVDVQDALIDLSREFEAVDWSITAADRAQLALPAGEHVFIACQAEWMSASNKGDEPDGTLFLTNKRLLFEQTAQGTPILGFLGSKKKEGGVLWAVALSDITALGDERKGLFSAQSVITLRLSAGAPFPEVGLNIKGSVGSERLVGYIKRAKSGALTPHQGEVASGGANSGMNATPKQSPVQQQSAASAKPKQADPLDDARALADQLAAWVNAGADDRTKLTPITYSPQFERSFFFALSENMLSDKALEHATVMLCEAKRRHPIAAALKTGRLPEALRQRAELLLKELFPNAWNRHERGETFITEKFADLYDDVEPTARVIGGLPAGTLVTYGGAEFGKQFLIDARTGKYYYAVFIK